MENNKDEEFRLSDEEIKKYFNPFNPDAYSEGGHLKFTPDDGKPQLNFHLDYNEINKVLKDWIKDIPFTFNASETEGVKIFSDKFGANAKISDITFLSDMELCGPLITFGDYRGYISVVGFDVVVKDMLCMPIESPISKASQKLYRIMHPLYAYPFWLHPTNYFKLLTKTIARIIFR